MHTLPSPFSVPSFVAKITHNEDIKSTTTLTSLTTYLLALFVAQVTTMKTNYAHNHQRTPNHLPVFLWLAVWLIGYVAQNHHDEDQLRPRPGHPNAFICITLSIILFYLVPPLLSIY